MFDRATYPGTLCDIVCHGLDFCRWLTGAEPVRVVATHGNARYPDRGRFEDHARTFFDFDDGSAAIITADWLWPEEAPSFGEGRVIVTGTHGTATLRSWTKSELEVALCGTGLQQLAMPKIELRQFIADLVDALQSGKEPPIGNRDVFHGSGLPDREKVRGR
jgi:predicted dehydrogenase